MIEIHRATGKVFCAFAAALALFGIARAAEPPAKPKDAAEAKPAAGPYADICRSASSARRATA